MPIREQLKLFRKMRGISQIELAKKLDMSHDQISQIERGVSNPGQATLEKICKELGLEQKLVLK